MILSKIKLGPKVAITTKNGAEKHFKGDQCKGDEFQSYVKFSKAGEKRILEKI